MALQPLISLKTTILGKVYGSAARAIEREV
jgi:hypothetical protein